jgi:4-diphosphocytidyl-2-C-methyl-D-erythritol kinase
MERRALIVPAPAKVNLFLHVVGRRDDGYHLLESAMCFLRFGDTLTLTAREDDVIEMTTPTPGVVPEDDLCVRAARALRGHARKALGVSIAIEKRIPMGAGLGGGSSDAASVLLALNRLWGLHLPRATLMKIGVALGADVPFFIFGHAAIARGIGEQLCACSIPAAQIWLAKPNIHVPTPSIFSQTALKRNYAALEIEAAPLSGGENALQPVAETLHPEITHARARLGPAARMTGSGAAVFTLERPRAVAENHPDWHISTHLLAQHPLAHFTSD